MSKRTHPSAPDRTPAPAGDVPVVGPREPCPCGSGRRYKACHGRASHAVQQLVARPFAGREDECEWIALRELVPSATATLKLTGEHADRTVTLATVLPMAWPAMVRPDLSVFLGLQVPGQSGDVSRDLAAALELALAAETGGPIIPPGLPGPGPRLQELLDPAPIVPELHTGFEFWLEDAVEPGSPEAASLEQANASVVPTARLSSVRAAYWCNVAGRTYLRWVMPDDEELLLDAMARVHAAGALGLGDGRRYLGAFRAHGLLVPVWELPAGTTAEQMEEPAVAVRARLDEALAQSGPLSANERRSRAGLLGRQLTLR